jgi:hypothetical protein
MSIAHWYGNDIQLAPNGDVALATGIDRVSQRLLRVLLTSAQDYIWHPTYGIGAGKYVGAALSPAVLATLKAKFRGQILTDPDVGTNPLPRITFDTAQPNLLGVTIQYTYRPSGQLQTLSFNVANG